VFCLARAVGDYCVRALRPSIDAGSWNAIAPVPGVPCYDSMVDTNSATCPACASTVQTLLTDHGCCAIALFKLVDYAKYVSGAYNTADQENRDDPSFPSNKFRDAFNTKCGDTANQIRQYCTNVTVAVAITLRNIRFTYYATHAIAFHDLVINDVAQFLGMVQTDITIAQTGTQVQGTGAKPWYSSVVPSAWVAEDSTAGVSLTVTIQPDNSNSGASVNSFLANSLSAGSVPFPNAASDIAFVADPSVAVSADGGTIPGGGGSSSAASHAASLLVVTILMALRL